MKKRLARKSQDKNKQKQTTGSKEKKTTPKSTPGKKTPSKRRVYTRKPANKSPKKKKASAMKRSSAKGKVGIETALRTVLYALITALSITLVILIIIGPRDTSVPEGEWTVEDSKEEDGLSINPLSSDQDNGVESESMADQTIDDVFDERQLENLREQYPAEELQNQDRFYLLPPALQDTFFSENQKPQLIFVIDDAGSSPSKLNPFLEIPFPITIAVLPQLAYSEDSAVRAYEKGHEIIAHMPMEASTGQYPGPGTILTGMDSDEILLLLEKNMSTIPHIIGFNNHMGSAATADREIMQIVLEFSRNKNYIFLDSRTSANSVARELAATMDYSILERDVFLDNETNRESMIKALEKGKEIAKSRGYAVMIGHIWTEELADILIEQYPLLLEEGYDFNTLSSLIMQGDPRE